MKRVVMLALFASACSSESSSSLGTDQIAAYYRVEITDSATAATNFTAKFEKDLTTDVSLEAGDKVTVSTDKDPNVALVLSDGGFYRGTVSAADRTTATFAFTRSSGTSAPRSTIPLPAAAAFTSPTEGATVAYGDGTGKLPLTWSNAIAGGKVIVFVDPCSGIATTHGSEQDDVGSYAMSTKELVVSAPTTGECLELTFQRTVKGQVDPALKQSGSTFEASRTVKFKVTLTP